MQAEGYPHPCNGAGRSGKGGANAEVCTSAARKIGEAACGRVGAGPLAALRVGVAGRNRPAEKGGGRRGAAEDREEASSLKR